jgi:uncharacterized RDD family membrane protein YckC
MNSRFKPDDGATGDSRFPDPESLDASQPPFVATHDAAKAGPDQRFIVEARDADLNLQSEPNADDSISPAISSAPVRGLRGVADGSPTAASAPPELILGQEAGWRREVAAKVNRYKARKPRPPRYPSLQLKFEPRESWKDPVRDERPALSAGEDYPAPGRQANALQPACALQDADRIEGAGLMMAPSALHPSEATGRILEFPRAVVLPSTIEELAEPVSDTPRILEVPEQAPPGPALGGISIEPVEPGAEEKRRPGIEIPLQSARLSRRLGAASIDGLLVMIASALFGYVFFRITAVVPPLREIAAAALVFMGLFWAGYQYLLLVHAGITPGLILAKLQLHRFDGSPVPLPTRRWRVLASFLSALSLGIGYAWCFLDEDRLCWHDRITHTYMAPATCLDDIGEIV